MKTKLILFLTIVILSSCSSQKNNRELIRMEQIEARLPVSLLGDTTNGIIVRCRLPLAFKIYNSSSKSQYVQFVDYFYHGDSNNDTGWIYGSFRISQYINNELKISTSQRLIENEINNRLTQEFIIEPSYDFDTCRQTQALLEPYIKQMKALHTNKLSINSFKKFQEKHPALVEALLQGDSIRIIILEDSNNSYNNEEDKSIRLPIAY